MVPLVCRLASRVCALPQPLCVPYSTVGKPPGRFGGGRIAEYCRGPYLALLLTHALLAQLGARTLGCALGAIVFAFSPFEIAWAYYPLGMTTCFLPGPSLFSPRSFSFPEKRSLIGEGTACLDEAVAQGKVIIPRRSAAI